MLLQFSIKGANILSGFKGCVQNEIWVSGRSYTFSFLSKGKIIFHELFSFDRKEWDFTSMNNWIINVHELDEGIFFFIFHQYGVYLILLYEGVETSFLNDGSFINNLKVNSFLFTIGNPV